MNRSVLIMIFGFLALSGCSILPYENEFSCRTDNYGRCVTSTEAYNASLNGRDANGPPVNKDEFPTNSTAVAQLENFSQREQALRDYQSRRYKELSGLIEAPHTPMLTPPKTIRALILPYSPSSSEGALMMPRFVFVMVEQPTWVLDDARSFTAPLFPGLADNPAYMEH